MSTTKKRSPGTHVTNSLKTPSGPPPAASPKKREGGFPAPGSQSQKRGKQSKSPTVTVYAFRPELGIEAYTYTKNDDDSDAFCNDFRKFTVGEIESKTLAVANFTGFKPRRHSRADNFAMQGNDGYWRHVFLRYVPGSESTPDTRSEGLKVLTAFLSDKDINKYSPTDIVSKHGSNCETYYFSLDSFFQDDDIQEIIETVFEADELVPTFFSKYPDMAAKLWSVGPYPAWARDKLGFEEDA